MRVTAGEARGVPLVAPAGQGTRPTSDKLKAAIFATLGDLGCEGSVLDLFAGSGALGIEALSRGADRCDFVEAATAACKAIQTNLAKTKLAARGRIYQQPATRFIASAGAATRSSGAGPYDLILADPPYALSELEALLETLDASPLVSERTVLLVEHAGRRSLPLAIGRWQRTKARQHGDSAFSLYLPATTMAKGTEAKGTEATWMARPFNESD